MIHVLRRDQMMFGEYSRWNRTMIEDIKRKLHYLRAIFLGEISHRTNQAMPGFLISARPSGEAFCPMMAQDSALPAS